MMKSFFLFITLLLIASACSAGPAVRELELVNEQAILTQDSSPAVTLAQLSQTPEPTQTPRPSPSPTGTPTSTPTSTQTLLPSDTPQPSPTLTPSSSPPAQEEHVVIIAVNKRDEYVDIQNQGAADVDLSGWNLVSERGNQECPLSGMIQAGAVLRIWSMSVKGEGFSCGYSSPIWNNSEPDPAVLYNAQGVEVSRK